MILGAMSKSRTAELYFLSPETTMNGSKYVELLQMKTGSAYVHSSVYNIYA